MDREKDFLRFNKFLLFGYIGFILRFEFLILGYMWVIKVVIIVEKIYNLFCEVFYWYKVILKYVNGWNIV